MRRRALAALALGLGMALPAYAGAEPDPKAYETLFATKCASCHTVGGGVRVGPDLKGVHERRDPAWMARFIHAPSAMLDSDPEAIKLVREFHGVRMPDLGLSEAQAKAMVAMLKRCSSEACELAPKLTPATAATPDDLAAGERLFLGVDRFKAGGPPCVSCHTVRGVGGMVAGGTLSKDLSHVFAKLGDDGLDAALRNPTFKVMNKVFADTPLEEGEVFAVRAFLYDVNRSERAGEESLSFVLLGAVVAIAALFALNAAWSRRLRGVRKPLTSEAAS